MDNLTIAVLAAAEATDHPDIVRLLGDQAGIMDQPHEAAWLNLPSQDTVATATDTGFSCPGTLYLFGYDDDAHDETRVEVAITMTGTLDGDTATITAIAKA